MNGTHRYTMLAIARRHPTLFAKLTRGASHG